MFIFISLAEDIAVSEEDQDLVCLGVTIKTEPEDQAYVDLCHDDDSSQKDANPPENGLVYRIKEEILTSEDSDSDSSSDEDGDTQVDSDSAK